MGQPDINKQATWNSFKTLLKTEFKLWYEKATAQKELTMREQGRSSVNAYNQAFNMCIHHTQLGSDAMHMFHYLRGLNQKYRKRIHGMDNKPTTLKDLQSAAAQSEQDIQNEETVFSSRAKPLFADTYVKCLEGVTVMKRTYLFFLSFLFSFPSSYLSMDLPGLPALRITAHCGYCLDVLCIAVHYCA